MSADKPSIVRCAACKKLIAKEALVGRVCASCAIDQEFNMLHHEAYKIGIAV